jgi:uncharacterized membrane protein
MIKHIRRIFLTGLLVFLPIVVTFSIVGWLFNKIDSLFREPLETIFGFPLVGIGFVLTILLVFITGIIASNFFGKKFISWAECIIRKIPIVKTIYIAIKQIIDTVFEDRQKAFKSAVLVQYPSKGIYALGFITSEAPSEIQKKCNEDMESIFIPTTPNPTSGMLVMIPEKDIIFLDMPVESAIKLIISGGIIN